MAVGVIANTTESMMVPLLVMVCTGMFPMPLVLYPLNVALAAVHPKVVPVVVELRFTAVDVPPLQIVCGVKGLMFGKGFTQIVSYTNKPGQPAA